MYRGWVTALGACVVLVWGTATGLTYVAGVVASGGAGGTGTGF